MIMITSAGKKRIFFFSTLHTSFIQDDLAFLRDYFQVSRVTSSGLAAIPKIIFQSLKTDIAFCWFASTYSALVVGIMRLLRKPSLIVVGGVDVAQDAELGYGVWVSPWKARLVQYALKNAHRVLVVDGSLATKARSLAGYAGNNILVVPTGYDGTRWKMSDVPRTIDVLTVASVDDMVRFRVKGLDALLETAGILPHLSFTLIGLAPEISDQISIPSNMKILPAMNRTNLLAYYQSAKVYCQPSRHEGLSNVLCEAMLCGCLPVATDVGGTQHAVGDTGLVVTSANSEELAKAIQQVCEWPDAKRTQAHNRIVELYSLEKRRQALREVVEAMKS
jgi:glycosyltransferase involved in cell wall biosynthesis